MTVHTRDRPLAEDVDLHWVAEQSEEASGADLAELVRAAARAAARRQLTLQAETIEITSQDFLSALDAMRRANASRQDDFVQGKGAA